MHFQSTALHAPAYRAGGSKIEVARPADKKCCLINYSWGTRVLSALFFYIYLPLAVTLNAVNTTDPRPIASWQKMSSEHTWHLDVDRFGAADVHKSRPIYCCFNYSWRWPKSGLAMAWLAGPLPPALAYPEQSHGRLTLKFCCIHVHVYLKVVA